ncbi:glycosyltransferase family 9 protein [Izhakiella capsodis]|uniref:glycosyltransferase family 9 protein n=1 Tax=Izhakiella capsodis TaxID=1367852 RepID=UPI001E4DCA12|nr:glycosyltransferase family 9 protein [Izhakiella capsodis]
MSAHYDHREQGGIHFIEQKARLLNLVGINTPSKAMFLPAPFTAEQPTKPIIGIHAGASSPERCWPAEKFTRLIQMLLAQHPQVDIVLIGGTNERALNQSIIDGLDDGRENVRNLAGKTNLKQLAACIASFSCLVVGDTGPLHVAVALKTPVVTLFGSASTAGAAPIQDLHLHRMVVPDDKNEGITAIRVEEVYMNVNQSLRANARDRVSEELT